MRLPRIDVDTLLAGLRAGRSAPEVAAALGCSATYVRRVAHRNGVPVVRGGLARRAPTDAELSTMLHEAVARVGHNYGHKMMLGYLQQKHPQFTVGRPRVRRLMQSLFPMQWAARR